MSSVFRRPRMMHGLDQPGHSAGAGAASASTRSPDRRRGDRQTVLKSATIVFNSGYCTLGCHILDISDTGAMVRPLDVFLCPSEFVLQPRVGSARACEVVWRKSDKVGVRYV